LRVVPARTATRRRRRTILSAWATVVALLTIVAFHALLAQSQIALDRLEQQTAKAEQRYEEARYQRSLLASPARITKRAMELGLILSGQPVRVVPVAGDDVPEPPDAPSGTFGGYTNVKSTLSTTP
jgi:cell division protein FtsL